MGKYTITIEKCVDIDIEDVFNELHESDKVEFFKEQIDYLYSGNMRKVLEYFKEEIINLGVVTKEDFE